MDNFSTGISNFFWNLFNRPSFLDFADIILVAFIIYRLLMLTHGTRALQVLKGFMLLVIASWLSNVFSLNTLNWLLMLVLNNGAIVLMILFQPEFRQALEHIGRGAILDRSQRTETQEERLVNDIAQSIMSLSKRRIGALMVFEHRTGLKDFIDTGVELDAMLTGALLVNIFEPNTPLHDGAVIIRNERIAAAACVLTLSEEANISRDLGTRHRAGLGVSESTDATVIIVSEETGIVSMAKAGRLTRHLDLDGVKEVLTGIFGQSDNGNKMTIFIQDALGRIKQLRKKDDEQQQ